MDKEPDILSKISELNINGYYDSSNGYVVVWFHNSIKDKPDIVAYLQSDMSWDVREVVKETSTIYSDCEVVEMKHSSLGQHLLDSDFDKIVRKMIDAMIEASKDIPEAVVKMKDILDQHSYIPIFESN
jgi:hypothetical protein